MSQYQKGLEGEAQAEAYLTAQGYQVVERRLRGRQGEVDLLVSKNKVLYFVEVKYRPGSRLGSGIMGIGPRKKELLLKSIRDYVNNHPGPWRLAYLEITRAGIHFVEDVLHGQ